MITNVTPVLVTRGNVPMGSILDSMRLTFANPPVVWDNSVDGRFDFKVFGRYAGTIESPTSLIYVQDDDVLVDDPGAIVEAYEGAGTIVCNMPPEFRHGGYTDSALVGFGSVFHRLDALTACAKFVVAGIGEIEMDWFYRVCDVPVTTLLERTLVDVPKRNLPWAEGEDRMYRQDEHVGERARALKMAREVRDA